MYWIAFRELVVYTIIGLELKIWAAVSSGRTLSRSLDRARDCVNWRQGDSNFERLRAKFDRKLKKKNYSKPERRSS